MRTREEQEKEKPTSLNVLLCNEQYRHRQLRKAIENLIVDWRTNDGCGKQWFEIKNEFADKLESVVDGSERAFLTARQEENKKLEAAKGLYNALSVLADACESMGIPVDAARAALAKVSP